MQKQITELLIKAGITQSSAKTYASNAFRVIQASFPDLSKFQMSDLLDVNQVSTYIKSLPEGNPKQNQARGIFELVKLLPGISKTVLNQYEQMYKSARNHNLISRITSKSKLDDTPENEWKKLKDTVDKIPTISEQDALNSRKALQQFMNKYTGMLYTLHPTLRPIEWYSSIFMDDDDGKTNHVSLRDGKIRIYKHKNNTGPRKHNLSPKLVEEMKKMNNVMKIKYPNRPVYYVLPKYYNEYGAITSNLTEYIKTIFGKKCGYIRSVYSSNIWKNGSDELMIYLVDAMGHQLQTAKTDYVKDITKSPNWVDLDTPFQTLEKYMHSGADLSGTDLSTKIIIKKKMKKNCCVTNKGNPCKFYKKPGEKFCIHHQNQK